MSEKYTPGPWHVSGQIDARYLNGIGEVTLVRRQDDHDNRYIAMCSLDAMGPDRSVQVVTTPAEREANARLIAEAPAMAEALGECFLMAKGSSKFAVDIRRRTNAVLSRIRGETK